jgi:hypothetical protein
MFPTVSPRGWGGRYPVVAVFCLVLDGGGGIRQSRLWAARYLPANGRAV